MKLIVVFILSLGNILLCSGNESRLSSIVTTGQQPDFGSHAIRDPEVVEDNPSLFSRWQDCLTGRYPLQKSMSLNYGLSYDPNNDHDFLLLSFHWKWKYSDVWGNEAPDSLYFRLETAGGVRLRTQERGVFSCGAFAQHYFDHNSNDRLRLYIDGGVGIIYTDFQNEDQGLRVNFNPRISIGADIVTRTGSTWFMAFRLSHISNAELHEDNRGVNAAMVILGRYY